MSLKRLTLVIAALGCGLVSTAAMADEIHDKTMIIDQNIRGAIEMIHVIGAEHGPEFGGHMGRAEALLRQADAEREAGMQYYRFNHPGWR